MRPRKLIPTWLLPGIFSNVVLSTWCRRRWEREWKNACIQERQPLVTPLRAMQMRLMCTKQGQKESLYRVARTKSIRQNEAQLECELVPCLKLKHGKKEQAVSALCGCTGDKLLTPPRRDLPRLFLSGMHSG